MNAESGFEFVDYSPEGDALRAAVETINYERSQWQAKGVAQEDLVVWFLQGATRNPDPSFWHPLPDGTMVAIGPRERAIRTLREARDHRPEPSTEAACQDLSQPAPGGAMHGIWMLRGRSAVWGTVEVDSNDMRFRSARFSEN